MNKKNRGVGAPQIKCCTTNDGVNHNKCFYIGTFYGWVIA